MCGCLHRLAFVASLAAQVWRVVASVLHIGNVMFVQKDPQDPLSDVVVAEGTHTCVAVISISHTPYPLYPQPPHSLTRSLAHSRAWVESHPWVATAARLLSIDLESLTNRLTTRTIKVSPLSSIIPCAAH